MCCLFTYFTWVLDFLSRLLTYSMSMMICCAITCLLGVAALAGVTLGYNYSLAEYIELKETNISVFLKRGVFDDQLSEDVNYRRSMEGLRKNEDSGAPAGADELQLDGRRSLDAQRSVDKAIVESNDRSSYEGALMKMSLTPLSEDTTQFVNLSVDETIDENSPDVLDKLEGELSNVRKSGIRLTRPGIVTKAARFHVPNQSLRRAMMDSPREISSRLSPYRLAVPDTVVKEDWPWPKEGGQRNEAARRNIADSDGRPMSPPTIPGPTESYNFRRPIPTIPKVKTESSSPARYATLTLPPAPDAPTWTEAPELRAEKGPNRFQDRLNLNMPTMSNREKEMGTMFPLDVDEYVDEPIIRARKRRYRRRTPAVTESLSTTSPVVSRKKSIAASVTTLSSGISGNNSVAISDATPPSGVSRKNSKAASLTTSSSGISGSKSVLVSVTAPSTGVSRNDPVAVSDTTPLTDVSRKNCTGHIDSGDAETSTKSVPFVSLEISAR